MRTTIDLPDDLHALARQLAHDARRSMSDVIEEMIRNGLARPASTEVGDDVRISPITGLPVVRSERTITSDDVKELEDE